MSPNHLFILFIYLFIWYLFQFFLDIYMYVQGDKGTKRSLEPTCMKHRLVKQGRTAIKGGESPTLFKQWCVFFNVPCREPWQRSYRRLTSATVCRRYPRRLESQMLLQRKQFLLSFVKTLSVGPARTRTLHFPLGRQFGVQPTALTRWRLNIEYSEYHVVASLKHVSSELV